MTLLLGGPLTGKTARLAEAYRRHIAAGRRPSQILCLSFYAENAAALRRDLRPYAGDFLPWVTTVQRFETLLLRQYARQARLPRRAREIEPGARALLLRHAWAQSGGLLWEAYHDTPGALPEFTRVVDWLSENRAGFTPRPGELGDHELARAYAAYLGLCERHRLLTFQEVSLRCLDLLALPEVAAEVGRRFPILLVDDAHLARPDQLRLLDRLRTLAADFLASAWLEPGHEAPELRFAWDRLRAWGPIESLAAPAVVNPAVREIALRLTRPNPQTPLDPSNWDEGVFDRPTVSLSPTVESEIRAAATAISSALAADSSLRPEDLALIAPPDLLPFAERVLTESGLPVAPRPMPARHTPLIRAALLVVRWARLKTQRRVIESELLALPLLPLEPLDRHDLLRAATLLDQPPLTIASDANAVTLSTPGREMLVKLARALAGLHPAQPVSALAEAALVALDIRGWLQRDQTFTAGEHTNWERAFAEWRRLVRELEAVVALGLTEPHDWLDHLEALAGQVTLPAAPGGIRLAPLDLVNGLRARHAFVLGLSENAAPRLHPEMQLIRENQLQDLLPTPPSLPLARHHPAWIEREARRLAAALTRGAETLYLSTSAHSAAGDAQLPSPFFERLLDPDGAIDRDGRLELHSAGLFRRRPATDDGSAQISSASPVTSSLPASSPAHHLPDSLTLGAAPQSERRGTRPSSASQLRAYLLCPLQYFYARVLGLETEGSSAMDRGGLVHELLCVIAGDGATRAVNLWDRPRPSFLNHSATLNERAMAALEAAWRGEAADLPGGGHYAPRAAWGPRFGPELQRQAVRLWVQRVLAHWSDYEAAGLAGRRRPVLLETEFEFALGPYRLRGRIDRIDEIETDTGLAYEVIDYKTGGGRTLRELMTAFLPPDGEPAADFQLPIYALALQQGAVVGISAPPRRVNFIYVEKLERLQRGGFSTAASRAIELASSGHVDQKEGIVPLPALTSQVVPAIQATLEALSHSPYPARPGSHCAYCSFRVACDRGQEAAGP
jgi:superfamily I DNA/RNA helicase/RecB family exonuclease